MKTRPFDIQSSKSMHLKCFQILNGWISDPPGRFSGHDLYKKKVFEYWTKGHDSNTGRHYCYHFIVFTQISCNLLALGYGGFFWFCLKSLFSVWHFLSLCPTDLSTKYQTFLCQIIECQESTDCLDYLNTGQIFKWPFKYWASFSGFFYNGDPNNGNFQIRDFSQFVNWMVH